MKHANSLSKVWKRDKSKKLIALVVEITHAMLIQAKWLEKNQDVLIVIKIDIILVLVMLTYCFKCKKDTESVDSKVLKTKNSKTMLSSKCAVVENQHL